MYHPALKQAVLVSKMDCFALGKSTRGDYTATVILLRDDDMDINYVIAADLLHCRPSEAIERITEYARMYDFKKFAIEINNFQEHMADNLERRIVARGRRLPIHKITSRSNKQSRIAGLELYIKQGNIRFCSKHRQLLDQLIQFPLAKNDDGPDALEMAMQAVKKKGGAFAIVDC